MTKVFVTGASGFIAKHILRELFEKGYTVRAPPCVPRHARPNSRRSFPAHRWNSRFSTFPKTKVGPMR